MRLRVLGSGSRGNCYLLENDTEALVIEAGVPFMEVKKALNFKIDKIAGVVVSHSHSDHAKYADEYPRAGIQLFAPYMDPVCTECWLGGFAVAAFNLVHDVPCWGFWIRHKDMGNLVYASDTEYIKYKFEGCYAANHVLVEANYSSELLDRDAPNREHVLAGHMSIDTAVKFLQANNNPGLKTVVLCHLSDRNSDAKAFKQAAGAVVDCPVYIAEPGLTVRLGGVSE